MADQETDYEAVLDVIASLADAGSSCSRTHIHKTMYLASLFGSIDPSAFQFVLHLYGPYSFELDQALLDLQAAKAVTAAPGQWGMGSSYAAPGGKARPELRAVCAWLGNKPVRELEAIATVAFIKARGPGDVTAQVHRIKPHLTKQEIQKAQAEFDSAKRSLATPRF